MLTRGLPALFVLVLLAGTQAPRAQTASAAEAASAGWSAPNPASRADRVETTFSRIASALSCCTIRSSSPATFEA